MSNVAFHGDPEDVGEVDGVRVTVRSTARKGPRGTYGLPRREVTVHDDAHGDVGLTVGHVEGGCGYLRGQFVYVGDDPALAVARAWLEQEKRRCG